jgi:hypothetical protein
MAGPQQQVDGYMGQGSYQQWLDMDRQGENEHRRLERAVKLLQLPFISPLRSRSEWDADLMDKIAYDYKQGMTLAAAGRRVNKEKLTQMYDLYSLSLGVMDSDNDVLEALVGMGLAGVMVIFPFVLFQAKANLMLDAVKELLKELKKAESEVTKAKIKMGIHAVVTAFELMASELALPVRAAIYVGEIVVDKALGPKDQTTAQKYVGDVTPGVKQLSEAIHHIDKYSEETRAVAEKTGKVATVATFYFDVEEIAEGSERVEKIKELITEAKKAHDELLLVIRNGEPRLRQFAIALERVMTAIGNARDQADATRDELTQDIRQFRYDTRRGHPLPWPIAA